jgi:hypothetical protein
VKALRSDPAGVNAVLQRIEAARKLAEAAECALRGRDARANKLRSAAERAHYELLAEIRSLSERDADLVEPAFTALEERLLGVYRRSLVQ